MDIDPKKETQKRLEIGRNFVKKYKEHLTASYFGGSMGFGQNYSVTRNSDIDLVIIVDKENAGIFFDEVKQETLQLFKNAKINLFWITKKIKNIEVNVFVYETDSFNKICRLEERVVGFIESKPSNTQVGYSFSGKKLEFDRKVRKAKWGYVYEKPILANNNYWGGPPKQDFLYSYQIIFEKDKYLTHLEEEVWKTAVQELIKESGNNLDLDKKNVLKSHFTYQERVDKLPKEVIANITDRTILEVGRYI